MAVIESQLLFQHRVHSSLVFVNVCPLMSIEVELLPVLILLIIVDDKRSILLNMNHAIIKLLAQKYNEIYFHYLARLIVLACFELQYKKNQMAGVSSMSIYSRKVQKKNGYASVQYVIGRCKS